MKEIKLLDFCVDFINGIPRVLSSDALEVRQTLDICDYLLQYRTLNLHLPRMSHKSTTILKLNSLINNSVIIVPSAAHISGSRPSSAILGTSQTVTYFTLDRARNMLDHTRGRQIIPYQYVLLDEVQIDTWLFNKSQFGQFLSYDTIIIAMSTPTTRSTYEKQIF